MPAVTDHLNQSTRGVPQKLKAVSLMSSLHVWCLTVMILWTFSKLLRYNVWCVAVCKIATPSHSYLCLTWLFVTLRPCRSSMLICCWRSSLLNLFDVFVFGFTPIQCRHHNLPAVKKVNKRASMLTSWLLEKEFGWLFICVNASEVQESGKETQCL